MKKQYMRCTNCGYDLYGHEYLSNIIDVNSTSNSLFFDENALLSSCTKPPQDIICPFCNTRGNWTSF